MEIPNLSEMLQCQNTPSLFFPAPKSTSFGFRNQNPLSFYFFHSHQQISFDPRLLISYKECSTDFPAPCRPKRWWCRDGLGGPSMGWVLTQLCQEDLPWGGCSPSHAAAACRSPVPGLHPNPCSPHLPAGSTIHRHWHRTCHGAPWD